jgi:hypothetical protein
MMSDHRAARQAHRKRPDTVSQPPRTEIYLSNMPSLKAKKLGNFSEKKYS